MTMIMCSVVLICSMCGRFAGVVVKAFLLAPRELQIRVQFPLSAWYLFLGRVMPVRDLKDGTSVAALPRAWCYGVCAGT